MNANGVVGLMLPQEQLSYQRYLTALGAKAVHPTSTLKDYQVVSKVVHECPAVAYHFPDETFHALIIECSVGLVYIDPLSAPESQRIWHSNIQDILHTGKTHLVTEVRIVMNEVSSLPLGLRSVLANNIMLALPGPLKNVRTIKFLGSGAFTAGQSQSAKSRRRDAVAVVDQFKELFPHVNRIMYYLNREWGSAAGFTKLPTKHCPLYEIAYMEYATQLEHIQLHNPLPPNLIMFCRNLTSVSVNVEFIRNRPNLPPLPIRTLRILDLLRLDGTIPWTMFEALNGIMSFDSLEELGVQFIAIMGSRVAFPDYKGLLAFPRLRALRISGTPHVYTDILEFFARHHVTSVHVVDTPTAFKTYNQDALLSVRDLRVMSPESTIEKGQYSVADVAKLFALDSNVEAATVGWLQYPIPKTICWTNLRKFNFTASIADYNSLANVIIQLPVLQSLSINCYSMIREDVVHTPFPDQKHTFSEIGEVFNSDDFTPLSMRLERLELMVYTGRFDYDGLCGLLTRLPQVTFIRTSAKAAAVVQGFFYNLYEGRRNVHVESFAT